MLSIFDAMLQHTHERVCLATDSVSGLRVVIALHNTVRGPAIGGVRLWQYDSEEAAIQGDPAPMTAFGVLQGM